MAYKDIAFNVPDGGKTPTDEEYTYTANDMMWATLTVTENMNIVKMDQIKFKG